MPSEAIDCQRVWPPSATYLIRHLAVASVGLYLLGSVLFSTVVQIAGLNSLMEVGYGDSYILYDVLNFEKTGKIYRDLSKPPYLAAQYSPSVYISYSLARYLPISPANVFLPPRLIALATFLACLGIVSSIANKLIPNPFAWVWAVIIAASTLSIAAWILQLRGDFLGIFFALSAIRFLMSRSRFAILCAGVCAGLAIQVKFTLLAAACSGFLWLLMRRRWKDTVVFALAVCATSVGLLTAYSFREPNMIFQMTALVPGIKDLSGDIRLLRSILGESVVLLAAPAIPFLFSRVWRPLCEWHNWTLLAIYLMLATALGFLTNLQAGGNINYFFEALLALTPVSVFGSYEIIFWGRNRPAMSCFLAVIFLIDLPISEARAVAARKTEFSLQEVDKTNRQFRRLERVLHGHSIFSLDPRIALIDPSPPLMEPFLMSYSRKLGHFDPTPMIKRLSRAEFEVFVLSAANQREYRGIRKFDGPDLEKSVEDAYKPYCEMLGDLFFLPRSHSDAELQNKLRTAGCQTFDAPHPQGSL